MNKLQYTSFQDLLIIPSIFNSKTVYWDDMRILLGRINWLHETASDVVGWSDQTRILKLTQISRLINSIFISTTRCPWLWPVVLSGPLPARIRKVATSIASPRKQKQNISIEIESNTFTCFQTMCISSSHGEDLPCRLDAITLKVWKQESYFYTKTTASYVRSDQTLNIGHLTQI